MTSSAEPTGGEGPTTTVPAPTPDDPPAPEPDDPPAPEPDDPPAPEPDDPPEPEGPGFIQIFGRSILFERCADATTLKSGTPLVVQVERLDSLVICLADQDWKVPPSMEVTLPNGSHEVLVAQREGVAPWKWEFTPGYGDGPVNEPGAYDFVVSTQGDTRSTPSTTPAPSSAATGSSGPSSATRTTAPAFTGRITVRAATVPRLRIPARVNAGDTLPIAVAGHDVGSDVTVVVYGPGQPTDPGAYPKEFSRLEQLPSVAADDLGEARMTWAVPADIASVIYGLWLESTPCKPMCRIDVVP